MEPKARSLRPWERDEVLDLQTMTETYLAFGHKLEPHIADTAALVWDALDADGTVLFEGAQAALLDIDHGTYPFVTSSNPVSGSAAVGSGAGPKDLDEIWGVVKAYCTRVGAGPFPTELDGQLATAPARQGRRARHRPPVATAGSVGSTSWRCSTRRGSARSTSCCITKLDVLSGQKTIKVATRYRTEDGAELERFPFHQTVLHHATPEYDELPGWDEEITDVRRMEDLPQAAQDYLAYIEEKSGVPIGMVGVGPAQDQVIWTDAGRASEAAKSVDQV